MRLALLGLMELNSKIKANGPSTLYHTYVRLRHHRRRPFQTRKPRGTTWRAPRQSRRFVRDAGLPHHPGRRACREHKTSGRDKH